MFSPLLFISPNVEGWAFPSGEHDVGWLDEFGNENITLIAKGSNSPIYYGIDTEFERMDVFGLTRICRISLPYDLEYKMNFDVTLLDYPEYRIWRDIIELRTGYGRFYGKRGRFR